MRRRLEDDSRWPAAASWAVGLLLVHAFLVLIQIGLAFRADLAVMSDIWRAVARVLVVVFHVRSLVQGRRWAWWVTTVSSGLYGAWCVLAAIAVLVLVRVDPFADDVLLPFGAVSVALMAGIVFSVMGAFCALVVGILQRHFGRPKAAPVLAGTTSLLPRQPSPTLGPILLLTTGLACALWLAAFMEARDGRLGVPDGAEVQARS